MEIILTKVRQKENCLLSSGQNLLRKECLCALLYLKRKAIQVKQDVPHCGIDPGSGYSKFHARFWRLKILGAKDSVKGRTENRVNLFRQLTLNRSTTLISVMKYLEVHKFKWRGKKGGA